MVCRLFGAKILYEPLFIYCQLGPQLQQKITDVFFQEVSSKYRQQKIRNFFRAVCYSTHATVTNQ